MRRLLVSITLLILPAFTQAQQIQEWDMPEEIKTDLQQPKCPEGSERDRQGKCVKKAPPPAPIPKKPPPPAPAPARRPVMRPSLKPTPAPAPKPPPEPVKPPAKESAPESEWEFMSPMPAPPATDTKAPLKMETPKPKATPKSKTPAAKKKAFVKGELASFVGSSKLVTKNNRIGLCLGHRYDDLTHYIFLSPEADIRFGKVTLGLGVPLALEVFDGHFDLEKDEPVAFDNAGSLRTEDWDEVGEYVRFIRYLRYGRKEDRLFFNLSQVATNTVGHGPLMRRYSVNIDPDSTRLSGELDAYGDYAGFEFVTNSVVDWDIFGGIVFVKPLSFFSDNPTARSVSIGITYLADRHAPVTLQTQTDPTVNNLWVLGRGRPQVTSDAFLHGMGVDLEFKLLKTEHVDIKPFIDYSWFMPGDPSGEEFKPEGGGGLTIGVLGRFNFGERLQAIRTIAEFRYFSSTYLPGYFDTFYEVQRFIGNQRYRDYFDENSLPPTKFANVFFHRQGGDSHLGFYLEFNYALVDYLAFTLALEGSDADGDNHFVAHIEVPALSWMQFFASYHQRGMASLGDLFSATGGDKLAYAAARLRALPFLFINFRYFHTFEIVDGYREITGTERQYRYYQGVHGWTFDFEVGWEF